MKKYVLTSPKFEGAVTFGYNAESGLIFYHNQAELTPIQLDWLMKHIPVYEQNIEALAQRIEGKLVELPPDLSFEVFWEAYGRKINRKRAEPLYARLSDADKLKAISAIKPYDRYLERTRYRGKVDPDNYLRNHYFETNWNTI